MKTLIIPRTIAASRINAGHENSVRKAFEKVTGMKVLSLGGQETSHGFRCVVVLDGVFTDTKVLEEISNYPFATEAWWYE